MKRTTLILSLLFVVLNGTLAQADSTWVVPGPITNQTWTAANSPYMISGNAYVNSLHIMPGVYVLFTGNYLVEVGGVLTAIGTDEDSIVFTRAQGNTAGWQGIFFNESVPGSEMAYCLIDSTTFHGLRIESSTPLLRNCTISHNSVSGGNFVIGGGIYVNGSLTLLDCMISGHHANASTWFEDVTCLSGGGYISGTLTLIRCTVYDNSIYSYTISASTGYNSVTKGAGLYVVGTLNLNNSEILNNSATSEVGLSDQRRSYGGGIYVMGTLNSANSIIAHNSVSGPETQQGGGIYLESGVAILQNNAICYNTHEGVRAAIGGTLAENSIFFFNTDAQLAGNSSVNYCDVQGGWGTGTGNISYNPVFASPDSLHVQPGSLCIDAGNPDSLYNDPENPMNPGYAVWPTWGTVRNDMGAHGGPGAVGWWVGAEMLVTPTFLDFGDCSVGGDTTLPLIITNTGTVNLVLLNLMTTDSCFSLSFDSSNTLVSPNGSFNLSITFTPDREGSFDDSLTVLSSVDTVHIPLTASVINAILPDDGAAPRAFQILPPAPNPFNPSTVIRFQLPVAGMVKVEVFNVAGRLIESPLQRWCGVGMNEIAFDGSGLPSGVYLYRLEAGEFRGSGKMVLLK